MDNKELYEEAVKRAKSQISHSRRYEGDWAHKIYVGGMNETLEILAGLTNQPFEKLKP